MLSLSGTVPLFVQKMAFADAVKGSAVSNDNILVVVQLSGGNDGLNTVIPHTNDLYRKARPTLGIKDRLLLLDDNLSLNPGLAALKEMYLEGTVAVINGCGYPEPNRSHFQSMEIWHTADPQGQGDHGGWLGHYLDHCCRGTAIHDPRGECRDGIAAGAGEPGPAGAVDSADRRFPREDRPGLRNTTPSASSNSSRS